MVSQAFIKSKLSLLVLASLTLAACGGTGSKSPQPQTPDTNQAATQITPTKPQIVAEPGLKPRERLKKAMNKMGNGDSEVALVELEAYLLEVPRSSRASRLISQIKTDSANYFPAEFFTLKLESGQSLSTLAKRYLGSAWEFYALAKYNDIANPSRVNIGTTIKIPLTQLAKRTKADEDTKIDEMPEIEEIVEIEDDAEMLVEAPVDIEDMIDESDISEEIPEVIEEPPAEITAQSLSLSLSEANLAQDYARSVSIVESLKSFGDLSPESNNQALVALEGHADNIKNDDPITASNLYSEAAEIYLERDEKIAAFERFKLASDIDAANTNAKDQMLSLQTEITEKYHREASTAFRQQALAEAISKWNVVLAVDPNHSNALAYRTQAMELKQKLEALQKN